MAEGIVSAFQTIQVDEEQQAGQVVATRRFESLLGQEEKTSAIVQPGQFIGE
ncbi:hypothetical protein FQZ97_763010 [compost metagenome]